MRGGGGGQEKEKKEEMREMREGGGKGAACITCLLCGWGCVFEGQGGKGDGRRAARVHSLFLSLARTQTVFFRERTQQFRTRQRLLLKTHFERSVRV